MEPSIFPHIFTQGLTVKYSPKTRQEGIVKILVLNSIMGVG